MREVTVEVSKGPGGALRLQPFRNHVSVTGAGKTVCLACGRADVVRARLARFSCPREGNLRRLYADSLAEGVFDDSISRSAVAISWAKRLGREVGPFIPPVPD